MLRPLMIATMLGAGAVTAARAGGPEIAYVKAAGSSPELYLVNADGTSLTKLYTAPRKTNLSSPDLKPGGNEVAFMEGLKVKIRAGLGEVHYGGWTGRSFKTLTKTKLWEQIQSFPSAARTC